MKHKVYTTMKAVMKDFGINTESPMSKAEWEEFRAAWLVTACFAKGSRMIPRGCHDAGQPYNEVCEACVARRWR